MESGAFPDVVPFSAKKEIFDNFHHPHQSEMANTMESNIAMGVVETHVSSHNDETKNKKKLSFFSVISLSRNYEEDPHWFMMEFTWETGSVGMVYAVLWQGPLVFEIWLAFRSLH